MENLNIGSTPYGEECAQVGRPDYETIARHECSVFTDQMTRIFMRVNGPLPEGVRMRTRGHNHDYGTYYEVDVVFNENDQAAVTAAFWLENNVPEKWDVEAVHSLGPT